jgi:membrane-associated phospholipid phosphatase
VAGVLGGAALGILGLLSGALWLLPGPRGRDTALMLRLNTAQAPAVVDRCLALTRLLGTTPFFLLALAVVAMFHPARALSLGVSALAAEGVTKAVKLLARRARPFEEHERVVERLARRPRDAGFPSGDAMRAAFLAGVAWAVIPPAGWLAALVAVMVGLGRIRAGVHYPLDVWAGWCVGLGASLAWLGWSAG